MGRVAQKPPATNSCNDYRLVWLGQLILQLHIFRWKLQDNSLIVIRRIYRIGVCRYRDLTSLYFKQALICWRWILASHVREITRCFSFAGSLKDDQNVLAQDIGRMLTVTCGDVYSCQEQKCAGIANTSELQLMTDIAAYIVSYSTLLG